METLILPLGDLAKRAENDSEQSERLSSLLSSFAPSHEDSGEKAFLSHKALAFFIITYSSYIQHTTPWTSRHRRRDGND